MSCVFFLNLMVHFVIEMTENAVSTSSDAE